MGRVTLHRINGLVRYPSPTEGLRTWKTDRELPLSGHIITAPQKISLALIFWTIV